MILYHGSKSGLSGQIKCDVGRKTCDFGQGFYCGEKREQPLSLVSGYANPMLYTLKCSLEGLNVLYFENTYDSRMDWALFVAYNRHILDFSKYPALCNRFDTYLKSYDVICGNIANDRMTVALDFFYRGLICDKALLDALEYVKLGRQYVFKTPHSCDAKHIIITDQKILSPEEKRFAETQNINITRQNRGLMEQLQTRYRRAENVLYYDEVLDVRRNG